MALQYDPSISSNKMNKCNDKYKVLIGKKLLCVIILDQTNAANSWKTSVKANTVDLHKNMRHCRKKLLTIYLMHLFCLILRACNNSRMQELVRTSMQCRKY